MMASQYFLVVFLLLTNFGIQVFSTPVNITSPPVTNWGDWGSFQRCPPGRSVQAFQLKIHQLQNSSDNTALNALRVFCGDPYYDITSVLTSIEGKQGDWGKIHSCFPGNLTGFQLLVQERTDIGDNTATNNLRVFCDIAPNPYWYVEGDGLTLGEWGDERRCNEDEGQIVCGLQTQVENCAGQDDCTGLNNILMECCDRTEKYQQKPLKNIYKDFNF